MLEDFVWVGVGGGGKVSQTLYCYCDLGERALVYFNVIVYDWLLYDGLCCVCAHACACVHTCVHVCKIICPILICVQECKIRCIRFCPYYHYRYYGI